MELEFLDTWLHNNGTRPYKSSTKGRSLVLDSIDVRTFLFRLNIQLSSHRLCDVDVDCHLLSCFPRYIDAVIPASLFSICLPFFEKTPSFTLIFDLFDCNLDKLLLRYAIYCAFGECCRGIFCITISLKLILLEIHVVIVGLLAIQQTLCREKKRLKQTGVL